LKFDCSKGFFYDEHEKLCQTVDLVKAVSPIIPEHNSNYKPVWLNGQQTLGKSDPVST